MTLTKSLFLSFSFALLLAACGSTDEAGKGGAEVDNSIPTVSPIDGKMVNLPPELKNPTGPLAQRSIYFDYDRFDVRGDYKEVVSAHAKILAKYPALKMLVQGNTDDRGSPEYNLALGQKRADAIKNSLILFGAREDQVESVSLGKEKPKAEGSNEAAWAENRRGDMLYSGEF